MPRAPSARSLVLVYVALVALAAASWLAAGHGGGAAVALGIAVLKAVLIAMVFMELLRAHPVDRVIALVALLFVVLLCAGALADVALR